MRLPQTISGWLTLAFAIVIIGYGLIIAGVLLLMAYGPLNIGQFTFRVVGPPQ